MRRLVALLTIVVGLAVTSGTASAGGGLLSGLLGGGCGVTAPVFLPWGDYSGYYFAPNGGFESGSSNWTLSGGAAVVTQAFHAVQRARRATRLEDDDAPVHCRARHGTDRRPLRRSVPDEGLGEEERASAVRSAGGAAQRVGLRAARRGAAGARSARVLRRRRRR